MRSWDKRDDMIVHEQDPYNAEPRPQTLAGALLTPVDTFYSRNHGPIPTLDPAAWSLRVDGLVERELEFSLLELQRRFDQQTLTATLQCAGNRRAGLMAVQDIPGEDPWGSAATSTAVWTGVRLADVLRTAGVGEGAGHVAFAAPDVSELADPAQAYGASIGLRKALAPEVLLAWAMNGEPLPVVHGAPLRVVVPGWIGARSVKWLQRITVQQAPSANWFQATAYHLLPADADPDGELPASALSLSSVALNSDILRPADGATLPAGPTEITGYAFAGDDREVARVDVSIDGGGSWVQADLVVAPSRWAWRHWRAVVELVAGPVTVTARAWDSAAALQPQLPEHVWNPKGYVNNSWPSIALTVTGDGNAPTPPR